MINIIISGLPGSGKGTQAKKLASQYQGMVHLESGDLLRQVKKEDADLAKKIRQHLEKGELVPDNYINTIISGFIGDHINDSSGFIFDGYPRTTAQADFLDEYLSKHNTEVHHLLYLKVSEEELINRLQERGREDDRDPEVVRNRIKSQKEKLDPIIKHYKEQDKVMDVDGEREINRIYDDIVERIPEL